jgi:hypothetical protein
VASPAEQLIRPQPERPILSVLGPWTDVLSKGIVGFVLALYASGFLIVSLHESKYGFGEANPFRTRVLAAGAWFFLLTGVPATIVIAYRIRRPRIGWVQASHFLYSFYLGCIGLNLYTSEFFVPPQNTASFKSWWFIVMLIATAIVVLVRDFKKLSDRFSATASIVAVALLLSSAIRFMVVSRQTNQPPLTFWFFGAGVVTLYVVTVLTRRNFDDLLGQLLFGVLTSLFLFATYYYPNLKASWGGGSPVPVTLYLNRESILRPNQSLSAQLVDESDAGFYIIGQDETKAVFVPRTSVSLVYFSDKAAESKLLK